MEIKKLSVSLVVAFLLIFSFSPAISAEENSQTLVVAGTEAIESLLPERSTGTSFSIPARFFYEGLLRLDRETGEPVPSAAKDWEVSEDGLTYTFHLHEGIQWHRDYGELTADDVAFTFNRHIDPDVDSVHRGQFWMLEEVEAVDDYTVKFQLDTPFGGFLYNVTLMHPGWGGILSKAAFEELGTEGYEENPVGAGPYKWVADEYVPREVAVFERFEDYFKGIPPIDRLEYEIIPDEETRAIGVEAGDIDLTYFYDATRWEEFVEREGIEGDYAPQITIRKLDLNTQKPPFDKVEVRKALAYAIDEFALNEIILENYPPVVDTTILNPQMAHVETEPFEPMGYDPEKARELLAEVGLEPADIEAEFWNYDYGIYLPMTDVITASLRAAGFVNIDITPLERGVLSERRPDPESDGVIIGHPRWPDPDPFLSLIHGDAIPPHGINFTWWDEADELIDKSRRVAGEERTEVMTEIQHLLTEEMPQIPLLYGFEGWLWTSRVEGDIVPGFAADYRPFRLRIVE